MTDAEDDAAVAGGTTLDAPPRSDDALLRKIARLIGYCGGGVVCDDDAPSRMVVDDPACDDGRGRR